MNWIYLLLGLGLLFIAVLDALWTTLWIDGSGGPVTSRLTTWCWHGYLRVVGRERHRALSLFGPFIVMFVVVLWVLMMWAGWVLIFGADDLSLWNTRSKSPADWSDRIYFVAYTMFTMGNGDLYPQTDAWQVIASLTNGSGMLLVTLAVTYILSVISAAVQKRAFANQVLGLGRTPEEFVRNSWNGQDFRDLDLLLNSLSSTLSNMSEQYRAYPVLQYYHAAHASKSPPLAVAVLYEAMLILQYAVPDGHRPNQVMMHSTRSTIETFLETMPSAFISTADTAPPAPDLQPLLNEGIPVSNSAELADQLAHWQKRRKRLLGLIRNDGWNWMESGK